MPSMPDRRGHFGVFGGRYIAELLMPAVLELEEAYKQARRDRAFQSELKEHLRQYVGRETPLYYARRLSERLGGAKIYLKREDLCHTGSHKINNALGQVLLARRMGKERIIAETGAGQHGVATATVTALFGMTCQVYMGREDVERQALNVFRMKLLGASVHAVESGSKTLKDAINEALRDWVTNVRDTYYLVGSTMSAHPYPMMVRDFQSVIGREARRQVLRAERRLPDCVIACVGGGSNAMGIFHAFLEDPVRLIGVEAGGSGIESGHHSASITAGHIGVLHGKKTYVLQDELGQIRPAHSISAGLDYPGVGPEHAYLHSTGRAEYVSAMDDEAVEALQLLSETEGVIPALETAHAIAHAAKVAREMSPDKIIVVNLSGRGDKDMGTLAAHLGVTL